jgi:hypothetical protein
VGDEGVGDEGVGDEGVGDEGVGDDEEPPRRADANERDERAETTTDAPAGPVPFAPRLI